MEKDTKGLISNDNIETIRTTRKNNLREEGVYNQTISVEAGASFNKVLSKYGVGSKKVANSCAQLR